MNRFKIFFPLFLLLSVGCVNTAADNSPINVQSVNVQELDDEKYIKEQEKSGSKKIKKDYKLSNINFTEIDDDEMSECENLENIILDTYVIKNISKQKTLDKTEKKYTIYNITEEGKCKKVTTKKNSNVIKAVEGDGKVYLEVKNNKDNKEKSRLYVYDGKKMHNIKKNMKPVNNIVLVNGKVLVSYGGKIGVINDKNKLKEMKIKFKTPVWTISSLKDDLYIMFRNKENKNLTLNTYSFAEDAKLENSDDLVLKSSRKLNFQMNSLKKEIKREVSYYNQDYIVHSSKMICKVNYSACKVVVLEDETIQNVIGDLVIYNSDKSYISNFNLNTKESISSSIIKYAKLNDKELLLKIYDSKQKDYKYFKYEMEKGY